MSLVWATCRTRNARQSAILSRMEASATTDEALLARYVAGDVAAFEQLYLRHERPLWRYLMRQYPPRENAEELMQDVWSVVVREAVRFRSDGRFTPWLYTLARNRIIDRYRTRHPHQSLDAVDDQDSTLADRLADEHSPSPLQTTLRNEVGQAILAALAQLPAEQRETFVLQADTGMSVDEIAQVTGATFETVKSRLRYARDKLRQKLQDYA
jgi:RNA polymerase sigma factor (sigma-70 family)